MHRLMMLSSAYQMSSDYDARAAEADPGERRCCGGCRGAAWKPKPSATAS